jgi:type II secretory pathway pseudopilin PulG
MRNQEGGFTYAIALFAIAILSVVAARALENIATQARREREEALLQVGELYRDAIAAYYAASPGSMKQYPPDLKALLEDTRHTSLRRPLRRLYPDPLTGTTDWGIVAAADGGVMGVYSRSTQVPLKTGGFASDWISFTAAKQYSDWKFVFQPS